MRRYRFDASVGRPVSQDGNDFLQSPLTAPRDGVRVACFHLGPGGQVGRHPADLWQLFCVVAGEGWVSGPDGEAEPIGPGEAAWWERGEVHAAGTSTGMTVFVLEGEEDFRFARLVPAEAPRS